jgi:hypothetical protein
MIAALGSLSVPLQVAVGAAALAVVAGIGYGVYTGVEGATSTGAGTKVLGEHLTAPATPSDTNPVSLDVRGALDGDLRPGVDRTLTVVVTNPNPVDVDVTSVEASVGAPTGGVRDARLPSCDAAWVTTERFASDTSPLVAPANGEVSLRLSVRLDNLPAVDQDNCKTATFPITLAAAGRQAT